MLRSGLRARWERQGRRNRNHSAVGRHERRRGEPARWVALFSIALLVLSSFASVYEPAPVAANHGNIKLPFAGGSTWYVSQGYNTSPAQGGSHYNCDPLTLRDAPSQTRSCTAPWQYKYSLDFQRVGGGTAGQSVFSPVNGVIRWIDQFYGGMSIDLGDGYAVAYFHTDLAAGLAAGQTVRQGQYLGTVSGPGGGGNGGTPHLHLTIWATNDGGNWNRNAVPFTDGHTLDGVDLPALAESTRNQHVSRQITSSNAQAAASEVPGAPTLVSPPTGTTYQTTGVRPTLSWNAVSGASEYQVVINDGAVTSPWVSGTSWQTASLANGQYAWQVRARNSSGNGNLSAKWVFWVDPAPTNPPPPPGPGSGALGVTLGASSGSVGAGVTASGTGYGANETVRIYWDTQSSTAIASTTANSSGSWSVTFTVPQATGGNHTVIGRGATTTRRATAGFRVNPSLVRAPYQGTPGTSIAVTVNGFGGNESVRLTFQSASGPTLATVQTNSRGTGNVGITMPEASSGWHDYTGLGLTSGLRAWGALLVQPLVTVSPSGGAPGTTISLSAKGFPAGRSVAAAWNKTPSNPGATLCSGSLNGSGNYSCTFRIPQSGAGSFPVVVTASDGTFASATVGVTGNASVTVTPNRGHVGTDLSVSVGGFSGNENITFTWDNSSTAWQSRRTDGNGALLLRSTVPNLGTGSHTLRARGASSGRSATATFEVASGAGTGGTSMIAPGTYAITATREGLVGFTTSNGHRITPNDHFIALPACTATNCPWLTPGTVSPSLGYVTDCGDNCFVRIVNPATDKCTVAPIWDTGPWFTNDNWWDPVARRNLNNLPSTVNILAQGYTGADAAMNGLDVGYGIAGSGRGISNVGYDVANRAAMDIADGSWVDIGFDYDDGIGRVVVTLLWQTGEDHAAAARACESGSTPPSVDESRISISPNTGPAGTTIRVDGSGFRAGERVGIYWDSTSSNALTTVTANGSGAFSTSIQAPNDDDGRHLVAAKGLTSGWKASRSYTLAEPPPPPPSGDAARITIAPTGGPAGTTIQVTGAGFQPRETVRLYWDSTFSTALRSVTADGNGAFTGSIQAQEGDAGSHLVAAKGVTSGWKASRSFTLGSWSATDDARISISPLEGQVGTRVSVSGHSFLPGEEVQLFWDSTRLTPLTSTTANGSGAFSTTVEAREGAAGRHLIVGMGTTSGWKASRTYSLGPSLSQDPGQGEPGDVIEVAAQGFGANETVELRWGSATGTRLSMLTTDSDGTGTGSFEVPAGSSLGAHAYVGIGMTSNVRATGTVKVITSTPTVIASPSSGVAGSRVDLIVGGFGPNERVEVTWDARTDPTSSATTDESGLVSFSAAVPTMPGGEHTFTVRGVTSGKSQMATFTVVPNVSVAPESGLSGSTVIASGKGWDAGETVSVYWNRTGSSNGTLVCSKAAASSGSFACSFTAPSGTTGRAYPVVAVSGSTLATTEFTINGAGTFTAQDEKPADGTPTPTAEPTTTPDATPAEATPEAGGTDTPVASPTNEATETPIADDEPAPEETPTPTPDVETTVEPTEEATEAPTEEPADAPTEEAAAIPTEEPLPTPTPEPVAREVIVSAVSDTSVNATTPDGVQPSDQIGMLPAGGPDNAVAFVTFQVEGIGAGTVVDARLILTPVGDVGAPGGIVGVLPGFWADEATLTYNTAPTSGIPPALRTDGAAATIDWLEPWVEASIDVTGAVGADGTVTFVITGTPEQAVALASWESGAPARLVITVLDQ